MPKNIIEHVVDDHVMALVYEFYGPDPTEDELVEFERVMHGSVDRLRKSTTILPPPLAKNPAPPEPDSHIRPRQEAWKGL